MPSAALTSAAAYELVLTPAIRAAHREGSPSPARFGIPFSTETVAPGPSDAVLTVESFTMIEYPRYPSDPSGQKYYAPRLQLAETRGLAGVSVREMAAVFSVPRAWFDRSCLLHRNSRGPPATARGHVWHSLRRIRSSSFEFPGRRAGPGARPPSQSSTGTRATARTLSRPAHLSDYARRSAERVLRESNAFVRYPELHTPLFPPPRRRDRFSASRPARYHSAFRSNEARGAARGRSK